LSFLRLNPGQEEVVSKHFDYTGTAWLKVFGTYDLLSITHYYDAREIFKPLKSSDVIHLHTTLCFGWEDLTVPISDSLFDLGILGIFFLKIQREILTNYGAEAEQLSNITIRRLLTRRQRVSHSILGCLGWNESIVLIGTNDISDIFDFAVEVRQIDQDDILKNGSNDPFYATTYTIPTVNYKYIRNVGDRSLFDLRGKVSPRTFVSCTPGSEAAVLSLAQQDEFFPQSTYRCNIVLGKADIVIEPAPSKSVENRATDSYQAVDFGDFTHRLLGFRKSAAGIVPCPVFGTATILAPDKFSPFSSRKKSYKDNIPSVPTSARGQINYDDSLLEPFHSKGSLLQDWYLYTALQRMYATYNSCLANPYSSETFAELNRFMNSVLADMQSVQKNPPQNMEEATVFRKRFIDAVKMWEVAFAQRYVGSYGTAFEAPDLPMGYIGGIQRVLCAAASIPKFHVKDFWGKIKESWNGFIIFGHSFKYERRNYGVLNLPPESLLDPFDWWKLSHEIGHDVTSDIFKSNDIKALIEESPFAHDKALKTVFCDIIWEIASDVYDFFYGFGHNWVVYLTSVWRYLDKYLYFEGEAYSHFARTLMVRVLSENLNPEDIDRQAWTKQGKILKQEISQLQVGQIVNDIDPKLITDTPDELFGLKDWVPFLPLIYDYLECKQAMSKKRIIDWEQFWELLVNGYIPTDLLPSPQETLLQANIIHTSIPARANDLEKFSTRIAMLLYLWHIQVKAES